MLRFVATRTQAALTGSTTSNIGGRSLHLVHKEGFINGRWVPAISGKVFDVSNPATGQVIAQVPDMDVADAQKAIDAAKEAQKDWGELPAKQRGQLLRNWYNLMTKHLESIAKIVTAEAGKPFAESKGEVIYGNSFVEYFSEEARRIDGEIIESADPTKKYLVTKQAIGVAALITPWNFPHAMITRKASAALAAGCACVIRPAEDTPLTALALMALAHEAGIPDGVLNVITSARGGAAPIGELFCTSPKVAGISFTGSTQVGKLLYRQCSDGVKRLGLELGGNAPFIVYDSANLDRAVKGAMTSKFRNCGQTCVASNRFLIHEKIYDEFVERLLAEVKQLNIGDGSEPGVHIGPLINEAQLHKVSAMVQDAADKGAHIITGGKALPSYGPLFYEPTILTSIKPEMRVYSEEVFGPVINLIKFRDEEESLRIANATERGLAGYFYSENLAQIFRVSRRLEVGMCGVNEGLISAAEAPFGGVKESGLGREGSHHGIEDFTYVKYVCLGGL